MVMARKKKEKEKDIIDQLLDNIDFRGLTQDEVVGQDGLIKQLTGRILQRALEAEMAEHLGYEKNSNAGDNSRNGTFESAIIPKHEKRVSLFNDQIISMYSFGMPGKQIRDRLEKVHNIEASPDLIQK